ncbi:hypothetical protein [Nonomuraea sp. NPDC050691]|uniref:hypothetical protein n=1 Tax=Nonomuraea sp. NPDC050691 TaxID=3155661 RepID=UPI00340D92BB
MTDSPALLVADSVERCLVLAETWLARDGRPVPTDGANLGAEVEALLAPPRPPTPGTSRVTPTGRCAGSPPGVVWYAEQVGDFRFGDSARIR